MTCVVVLGAVWVALGLIPAWILDQLMGFTARDRLIAYPLCALFGPIALLRLLIWPT